MDSLRKFADLAEHIDLELAEETQSGLGININPVSKLDITCGPRSCGNQKEKERPEKDYQVLPVYQAALPNGKRTPLLKTLLTSACERNCYYCSCRAGRDFRRVTFQPDEMAKTFMQMHEKGIAKGIFLSSGVAGGGMRTEDRLIATAEILRFKLGFKGYLHLKIMPGVEQSQVERVMQLADRVSINLEAPTSQHLARLAPQKQFFDELLQPLRWVEDIRKNQPGSRGWNGHWASSTTQFVVGGSGETDLELLTTTQYLYQKLRLARAYYSGFSPVLGTPLENQAAVNPWRKNRLYQASFLLKSYFFDLEELPFCASGDLPLEIDPKLAWAQTHLVDAPVEINLADLHQLLRIPGIGPKGARSILLARKTQRLQSLVDLKTLGVSIVRAKPFILVNGKRPPVQLSLW